jgi:hypothetical protein
MLLAILSLIAEPGGVPVGTGDPNAVYSFNITAGIAALRFNDFSTQSGLQVLYGFEAMSCYYLPSISGDMKPFDALDQMIGELPITYEFVNGKTVTLRTSAPCATRTPWVYEKDGWYYNCAPFDWLMAFMLPKAYRPIWDIGVAMGEIPAEQQFCTPVARITEADLYWRAVDEVIIKGASAPPTRKTPRIRWKQ